jgi:hypothetical protein
MMLCRVRVSDVHRAALIFAQQFTQFRQVGHDSPRLVFAEAQKNSKEKGTGTTAGPFQSLAHQPLVTTGGGGALPLPTPYVCAEAATLKSVTATAVKKAIFFMK